MNFGDWLIINESKTRPAINRDLDKWFDRAAQMKSAIKDLKDALDKHKSDKPPEPKPEDKKPKPPKKVEKDTEDKDDDNKLDEPEDQDDPAEKDTIRDDPAEKDTEDKKKVQLPRRVLDGMKGKKQPTPDPRLSTPPYKRNRPQQP